MLMLVSVGSITLVNQLGHCLKTCLNWIPSPFCIRSTKQRGLVPTIWSKLAEWLILQLIVRFTALLKVQSFGHGQSVVWFCVVEMKDCKFATAVGSTRCDSVASQSRYSFAKVTGLTAVPSCEGGITLGQMLVSELSAFQTESVAENADLQEIPIKASVQQEKLRKEKWKKIVLIYTSCLAMEGQTRLTDVAEVREGGCLRKKSFNGSHSRNFLQQGLKIHHIIGTNYFPLSAGVMFRRGPGEFPKLNGTTKPKRLWTGQRYQEKTTQMLWRGNMRECYMGTF